MGAVGCARAMLQQGLFCPSGRRAHWGFHPPALKSPRLGFHYGVGGPVSLGFPSPGMGGRVVVLLMFILSVLSSLALL